MQWNIRNGEENSIPEGFREEVAFELGLEARVGWPPLSFCPRNKAVAFSRAETLFCLPPCG